LSKFEQLKSDKRGFGQQARGATGEAREKGRRGGEEKRRRRQEETGGGGGGEEGSMNDRLGRYKRI
jgi:hypothetical protein